MNEGLAIVIASYNCRGLLQTCLSGLLAGGSGARILVVDDASRDDTAVMVRTEFPSVTLLAHPVKAGYTTSCNEAIRLCDEPYILLLNADTEVPVTALRQLLDVMAAHPDIGACGPRLLNPDGSLQPSCRRAATLAAVIGDELGWRGRWRMRDWPHNDTRDVDHIMGACLLLRRAALDQVGLLDERFHTYCEDMDLCLRLKRAGWRVVFIHDAAIIHVGGQSAKTEPAASLRHRYRSLFEFYRKHHPRWQLPVLKTAVHLASLGRLCLGQSQYAVIAREVWRL